MAGAKIGPEEFLELADLWGYSEAAKRAIADAIADEDLGGGPWLARYENPKPSKVDRLEGLARELLGSRFALAVHSGTSALDAAWAALAIEPGDEVIVPAYTFLATASTVVAAGAYPVICEVDQSLTLDPGDIARRISPRTRAIAVVHANGVAADLSPILEIAAAHDLPVVEDVAQAFGGVYRGRRLGTWGSIGCFSLSTFKYLGGGEGGLVATDDELLHQRATSYHDVSGSWRPDRYAVERFDGELFCGTNARMSELEAAIDIAQLRKMDDIIAALRSNKRLVSLALAELDGIVQQRLNDPDGDIGTHLCVFLESSAAAYAASRGLQSEGIRAWGCGYGGVRRDWHAYHDWDHILKYKSRARSGWPWRGAGVDAPRYDPDMCPRTRDLLARLVIVAIEPWWTEEDCAAVADLLGKVLSTSRLRARPSLQP